MIIKCRRVALQELKPWDGTENAWLLVGSVEGDTISVQNLVPAAAERRLRSVRLRWGEWPKDFNVLGMIHTHSPDAPWPSEADLRADQAWVGLLPGSAGIFGILSDSLRWFTLREGDRHYTPVNVTEF